MFLIARNRARVKANKDTSNDTGDNTGKGEDMTKIAKLEAGAKAHLASLTRRHTQLDRAIKKQAALPAASQTALAELKKQKLRLKEQMEKLRGP